MIVYNDAFIYSATIIFIICYVSDLYTTVKYAYELPAVISSNITKISMRNILIPIGSLLALIYSIRTNNVQLVLYFTPILSLNIVILIVRLYYTYFKKWSENINANAIEPTALHPVSSFPNTLLNEPMQRGSEGTLPQLNQIYNTSVIITPIPWLKNLSQMVGFLFRKDTATTSLSNEIPRTPNSQNAVRIAPVWSYITLSHFLPSQIFSGRDERIIPIPPINNRVVPHNSEVNSVHNAVHGYLEYAVGRSIPSSHDNV